MEYAGSLSQWAVRQHFFLFYPILGTSNTYRFSYVIPYTNFQSPNNLCQETTQFSTCFKHFKLLLHKMICKVKMRRFLTSILLISTDIILCSLLTTCQNVFNLYSPIFLNFTATSGLSTSTGPNSI